MKKLWRGFYTAWLLAQPILQEYDAFDNGCDRRAPIEPIWESHWQVSWEISGQTNAVEIHYF